MLSDQGAWTRDNTTMMKDGQRVNGMQLGIHQRKWEMDSLCSVTEECLLLLDCLPMSESSADNMHFMPCISTDHIEC
jgi:hypothetical protein